MATKPNASATKTEAPDATLDEAELESGVALDAEEETEEETADHGSLAEDDPDAEEEEVSEDLFAELPVLPKGTYQMELIKCTARVTESDTRSGYRSGIEFTFEPDRGEFPDAPTIRDTVWASFYDDDKPGFRDMNRKAVKNYRAAGLFPDQVILTGKPGGAKKVKYDYDENIGSMFAIKVGVEEYQEEKRNRIQAIKQG